MIFKKMLQKTTTTPCTLEAQNSALLKANSSLEEHASRVVPASTQDSMVFVLAPAQMHQTFTILQTRTHAFHFTTAELESTLTQAIIPAKPPVQLDTLNTQSLQVKIFASHLMSVNRTDFFMQHHQLLEFLVLPGENASNKMTVEALTSWTCHLGSASVKVKFLQGNTMIQSRRSSWEMERTAFF